MLKKQKFTVTKGFIASPQNAKRLARKTHKKVWTTKEIVDEVQATLDYFLCRSTLK